MSTLNYTSHTDLGMSRNNMDKFINAVSDYVQTKAENTAIYSHLQVLSTTGDLSTFDPHTIIFAEFFGSLHELLSTIEPTSHLAWCCVNALRTACRNPAARNALIHTYQFLPLLSRLLGDRLSIEDKTRLLSLMQELTCGITISWQIPHLPHLMATLTRWIGSAEEVVVTLSLGVLVNLCYKNVPAIYTSQCVDIKAFLRTCTTLKGVKIEVHVCKLLITLRYTDTELPNRGAFLKLIEVTFKSLPEAFKARDSVLLRHEVEFFLDVWEQNNHTEALLNLNKYEQEVEKLLQEVEAAAQDGSGDAVSDHDPECVAVLFEFLHFLIQIKQDKLALLHPRLVNVALKWVQIDQVCSQAIAILRTVAINSTEEGSIENGDEEIPTHIENTKRLSALMELLQALMKIENSRLGVISTLKEEHLMKIFMPLLGNISPRTNSSEAILLYVNAIALVDELIKYDNWLNV